MPLKGFMISPYPLSKIQQDVRDLKGIKANHVRWEAVLPTLSATGSAYLDWWEGRLQLLLEALPVLKETGIKVVLDMHTPPRSNDGDPFTEQARSTFHTAWKRAAILFKGHSRIHAYDLMNEPPAESTAQRAAWNNMCATTVANIRAIDKEKLILKSSPYGDPTKIGQITTLKDDYWMPTVHMYYPMSITHQGLDPRWPTGSHVYDSNKSLLKSHLKPTLNFSLSHNVDIYVGEFGCSNLSGHPYLENRKPWFRDCLEIFKEYGWHWCVHAWREADVWNLEQSGPGALSDPIPDLSVLDIVKAALK